MHACMCMEGECLTSLTDLVGCKRDGPTRLVFGLYYAEWQIRASEMSNLLHAGIPRMKTSKRVCQSTLKHNLNMGHVMCTPPAQNGWGESGIKRQYGPRDFESSSNNLQLTFTESASNCTITFLSERYDPSDAAPHELCPAEVGYFEIVGYRQTGLKHIGL